MTSQSCRHWFTLLWWHFGEYGDQTVHVHSCMGDSAAIEASIEIGDPSWPESECDWVLIGVGRACGGKSTRHWRQSLDARVQVQVDRAAAGV